MSLAAPLASPFYTGAGVSAEVPGKWDCALNGHTFMYDWKNTYTGVGRFVRQSISLLKPQQDTSGNVSEASLNPEEFARRAAESWHHGAGQTHLDRSDSDPFRFRTSKGVDVWTKWGVSLLGDTTLEKASANTNLALVVAGSRIYLADGTALRYSTDLTFGTAASGLPAPAITGLATDGFNVYTTHAASGIYKTDTSSSASASYNTRAANGICGYVKGRLIVSNDNVIVNITGTSTETIILTHPNSAFRWVGVAEGPGFIYAAGYSGDKSLIYKTTIKADGTALDILSVAGELPDGEIVRSIQGYLGYLLVGTDKGLRLLTLDSSGDVSGSGRIIPTTSPVYCMEPQDRFVWYGLTDYDTSSTGLGRVDLGAFTETLTPAYATDLMASDQGAVLSVVTFADLRVFAVSGAGVYGETTDRVASGSVESGLVSYGLPDTKVAITLDVRHEPLTGSVASALSADGGAYVSLGSNTTAASTSLTVPAGEARAETFEIQVTLTRDSTPTLGPTVTRWTLEANPAPGRGAFWYLPLLLFEEVTTATGSTERMDVAAEYAALVSMETLGEPITYQDGMGTSVVFLDDHEFLTASYTEKRDGFNGTFVAQVREPRRRS